MTFSEEQRQGLELMQAEFESNQLEVQLVPCRREANVGAMYRVAVAKNCAWYREFCGRHLSSRLRSKALPDTCIKRRNVARALAALVAGRSTSKYDEEFLRIAARVATRWRAA